MKCKLATDDNHLLDKKEQVITFRLTSNSRACTEKTPSSGAAKKRSVTYETGIRGKLYGMVEELEKTASFINVAGLTLQTNEHKEEEEVVRHLF